MHVKEQDINTSGNSERLKIKNVLCMYNAKSITSAKANLIINYLFS